MEIAHEKVESAIERFIECEGDLIRMIQRGEVKPSIPQYKPSIWAPPAMATLDLNTINIPVARFEGTMETLIWKYHYEQASSLNKELVERTEEYLRYLKPLKKIFCRTIVKTARWLNRISLNRFYRGLNPLYPLDNYMSVNMLTLLQEGRVPIDHYVSGQLQRVPKRMLTPKN